MKIKKSIFLLATILVVVLLTMPVYGSVIQRDSIEESKDSCGICGAKSDFSLTCLRLRIAYYLLLKPKGIYERALSMGCDWAENLDPDERPVSVDVHMMRFLFNHKLN